MISAVARPMPRPAAVISATRPVNLMAPPPSVVCLACAPDPRPRDLSCQFATATLPAMKYEMISADCHLDLCWLPPDLFTSRASAALRDRMPSTGLYEDGKRGIRRITDPDLRLQDQDRDGVQAEVLYGVLGTTGRMNDPEAAVEVLRIYNEWLADFCSRHPERYAGLASIPNHPLEAAISEVERVVKRGALRGLDIANSSDLKPLWDPYWNPLWDAIDSCGLPLHFHTVGGYTPEHIRTVIAIGSDPTRANTPGAPKADLPVARSAFASNITQFQMNMSNILTSMIFAGIFERYPRMKLVLGESGIGWIPYVLWRMDAEWEDQFKDLSLTMPPSEYWRRQCWATYQTDPIGVKLLDELGANKVMWGSDFPHPDGVWPDSRKYVARELGHLPADVRRKVVCENAGKLYGLIR